MAGGLRTRSFHGLRSNYTGRLSEIRQAGYVVKVADRNRETGVVVYELEGA